MHSQLVWLRPDFARGFIYAPSLCLRAVITLARLCDFAGSSELYLLVKVIRTARMCDDHQKLSNLLFSVYTLKRNSKWPRFNFVFSDLALMILKWIFAQICAIQWTKVKWCIGRVFFHLTIFSFKNVPTPPPQKKKNEENKGFECIFFFIEVKVISNPSSRLEDTKPLNFCL